MGGGARYARCRVVTGETRAQAGRLPVPLWPRAKLFTKKWVALKILFALPEFGKHHGFCIITA